MKKSTTIILLTLFLAFFVSSCAVTRQQVGNYNEVECKPKVHKESKDLYLFWDLLPLRNTEKRLKVKNYEIVVKRSFFDNVAFYGTAGIVSFYTVKINIRNCDEKKTDDKVK